jgi:hypothetical protein
VRAYGVEKEMHDQFRDLLDANNRAYMSFIHTSRWLGIRLDFGAAMCLTTSALLSVLLRHKISPGYIGRSLLHFLSKSTTAIFFPLYLRVKLEFRCKESREKSLIVVQCLFEVLQWRRGIRVNLSLATYI